MDSARAPRQERPGQASSHYHQQRSAAENVGDAALEHADADHLPHGHRGPVGGSCRPAVLAIGGGRGVLGRGNHNRLPEVDLVLRAAEAREAAEIRLVRLGSDSDFVSCCWLLGAAVLADRRRWCTRTVVQKGKDSYLEDVMPPAARRGDELARAFE
eukprot:CAMPEP_0175597678 /NCGR_PEP_ID=MMETSP0096-20121207/56159_1 /TAXON_ID=311494 /ORGANISM="Alexandrium monilatum, Strain CCMP3105" /LENGTH=156 /DNA_ID=CAMNT_0016902155 /DNA_START=17 /DNA_END=485 /DNA_ORIENTATION=-